MKKTSRIVLTAILVLAMVASLAVTAFAADTFSFKVKDNYTIKDIVIHTEDGDIYLSDELHNQKYDGISQAKWKVYAKITALTLYKNGRPYEPYYDEGNSGNVYFVKGPGNVEGPAVFVYPQEITAIERGKEAKFCVVAIGVDDGEEVTWELLNGTKPALSGKATIKNCHADINLTPAQTSGLPVGGGYSMQVTLPGDPAWVATTGDILSVKDPAGTGGGNTPQPQPQPPCPPCPPCPVTKHHTVKVDVNNVGTLVGDYNGVTYAVAATTPKGTGAIGYNYNKFTDRHNIQFCILGNTITVSIPDGIGHTKVYFEKGNTVDASAPNHFDHVRASYGDVNWVVPFVSHVSENIFDWTKWSK